VSNALLTKKTSFDQKAPAIKKAPAGNRTSFTRKMPFTKKTLLVGVASVALLGGGAAAFAYPPGMDLSVSATAAPLGTQTQVLVSIQNSNPSCSTIIRIQGGSDTVFAPGQTTGTILIPAGSGSRRVEARTSGCNGAKEHAHSSFSIVNAKATGDATSPLNKNYVVSFTGLDADSTVTSTATLQGSNPLRQVVNSDNVNKHGTASTKFKLKFAGTWVVSTTISPSGSVNNVTVVVS
jgi:hypothetical protein